MRACHRRPRVARAAATPVSDELSSNATPFLSFRRMDVGLVPAFVGRVSFTGDLGYEIWVTTEYQRALHTLSPRPARISASAFWRPRAQLDAAREELRDLGARVPAHLWALRGGAWRFVDLRKPEFVGRAAAQEKEGGEAAAGDLPGRAADADAMGDEPIWHAGQVVGWVTSGVRASAPRSRSATCRRRSGPNPSSRSS